MLFKLLLLCFILAWLFAMLSPLAFPEPELSPLIFKVLVVSLVGCKNSWSYAPQVFKVKCYGNSMPQCRSPVSGVRGGGVSFSPLSMLLVSLPFVVSLTGNLVTDWVFALPTIFNVTSFVGLTVESLACQYSGCLLTWVHWYGCCLGLSPGQCEHKILLLCHLSSNLSS